MKNSEMTKVTCQGLRLLIVGPYPPPFGGIASHLVTLIPGLRARGAEDIAVVSFGDHDAVEQIDGATLYRFDARSHLRDLALRKNWRAIVSSVQELRDAGFGIQRLIAEATKTALINGVASKHRSQVVSFYQSDVSLALLPCARVWGRARDTVLTVFGECYDNPLFFVGRQAFARRFLARPHAVVASSKHCASSFSKVGVLRDIEAVYYGIDLERFASPQLRDLYRLELGVASDEVLVVYMGRFNEEMGIGRVLEIVPTLLERFSKCKLLLAGAKGPLSVRASTLAERFPNSVRILNDVPFDLQPSIYAASDMVLAPSHDQHACMGMSIKEAMAAARPVIGSEAGGIPEAIVHEETGFLVPLDASRHVDSTVLLRCIDKLARDSALRERMGIAARRRAEKIFSMDQTIDRMSEIFLSALPG